MTLQIYNSLTQTKNIFSPRKEGHIDFYVCGMTVYDRCHIGHLRGMVVFDVVVKFLRSQGWQVRYVRNITDIDDKIIARAQAENISTEALTGHATTSP